MNANIDKRFEFDDDYLQLVYKVNRISTVTEYVKRLMPAINRLSEKWSSYSLPTVNFSQAVENSYFEYFKSNYLKVIFFKAVVYAVFKERYHFVKSYLEYHQPSDSNTIWSNPNFSLSDESELLLVLELRNDILSDYTTFWIDHP